MSLQKDFQGLLQPTKQNDEDSSKDAVCALIDEWTFVLKQLDIYFGKGSKDSSWFCQQNKNKKPISKQEKKALHIEN